MGFLVFGTGISSGGGFKLPFAYGLVTPETERDIFHGRIHPGI